MINNIDTLTDQYFGSIIGQDKAKRKLSFFFDAYKKTLVMPTIMFAGANGGGKSMLARRVAELTGKEWMEINCALIKNPKQFVDEVLMDIATSPEPFCLFLDEIHAAPLKVQTLLLSILNPTKDNLNKVIFGDIVLEFDFKKFNLVCATTETQSVFGPLMNRMNLVSLQEYQTQELGQIIKNNSGDIKYDTGALELLSTYARGTGREAAMMGMQVINYASAYGNGDNFVLTVDMVKFLTEKILDVYPLGLTEREYTTLKYIAEAKGGITLTALCAKTNNSTGAQKAIEAFLQRNGLMIIEQRRIVTGAGAQYVRDIEAKN